MNDLGKKIKIEMVKSNMTNKELATRLGVKATYVSSMLSGKKKLSLPVLRKLKNIFPNIEIDLNILFE